MAKLITCASCERRVPPSKNDPDFCQHCYDRTEDIINNPMRYTEAAVAYLNTSGISGREHKRLKVAAFMSIFHPTVPARRVRALLQGIE